MHINIPNDGYHLSQVEIAQIVNKYNCKYIGYWCKQHSNGNWSDIPVDVFYDPNKSAEYSNYFGIRKKNGEVLYVDASSAFSSSITGIVDPITDEVLVSRYKSHVVSNDIGDTISITGGRDYIHTTGQNIKFVEVFVHNGEFVIRYKNV